MTDIPALLQHLADRWKLGGLTPVGAGLEFSVYRALDRDGRPVALRLAQRRFDANANDPHVDTRALLRQEYAISRHLAAHDFPVAEPLELVLSPDPDAPDVLLSRYVPDDGSPLDGHALGELLARLHRLPPPPGLAPVAAEGLTTRQALLTRIRRRWEELGRHVDAWPALPPTAVARHLAALAPSHLVHLDVRSANIRRHQGRTTALLDWSNALLGDPALEFGRLAEYARHPENQLDLVALRTGYDRAGGPSPTPDGEAGPVLACRLDAALMLALVFLSEAPDPARSPAAVERVRELAALLDRTG
ncbi:aminoglycoside phosphotransferase family protein [Kitasatospora sp. NPDC089797]|uniref:phosphotransferase family protein n=1 Tax=Kitasatospora sp. NPDC089797 TaxID=3155298 RepID=UPI00343E0D0E